MRRVTASARSPVAIVVSPQSADVSEFENTTLGISFIGCGERPGCAGPEAGPARVGRGAYEVRAGVAHGVEDPLGAVGESVPRPPSRSSRRPMRRSRRARRTSSGPVRPCADSLPGWITREARSPSFGTTDRSNAQPIDPVTARPGHLTAMRTCVRVGSWFASYLLPPLQGGAPGARPPVHSPALGADLDGAARRNRRL